MRILSFFIFLLLPFNLFSMDPPGKVAEEHFDSRGEEGSSTGRDHSTREGWFDAAKNGNIKRLSYVPSWLEKAIYFRDKGRCQICFKDVSGEIFHLNEYHLDHVLPLSEGGTNDPTNFQILCKECNLKKKSNIVKPKNSQVKFWAFE